MTAHELIQAAVAIVALLAAAWGFYSGWLPRWMRAQIGYYELKKKVDCIDANTTDLKHDHAETMDEIQSLKAGQVAIAESVANDHDVNAEALRDEHFGGGRYPGDFLRGGD